MTKLTRYSISASAVLLALSGCASIHNMPLIFGQGHIVGISASGSMPEQKVDLTIGYKDANLAIVPTTVKQGNGDSTQVEATATDGFRDGLSVLGQFEANTNVKTDQASVGLGKFFATGMAAHILAEGFADKLSSEKKKENQDSKTSQDEGKKAN